MSNWPAYTQPRFMVHTGWSKEHRIPPTKTVDSCSDKYFPSTLTQPPAFNSLSPIRTSPANLLPAGVTTGVSSVRQAKYSPPWPVSHRPAALLSALKVTPSNTSLYFSVSIRFLTLRPKRTANSPVCVA